MIPTGLRPPCIIVYMSKFCSVLCSDLFVSNYLAPSSKFPVALATQEYLNVKNIVSNSFYSFFFSPTRDVIVAYRGFQGGKRGGGDSEFPTLI